METLLPLVLLFLPAMVIIAAMTDLTSMTIPNWISLALLGVFPLAALAAGLSWSEVGVHVGVGLAAFAIGIGMFALNWLGGGDVKVMAALSLWLGLTGIGPFLLWTAIAGGVLGVAVILARSTLQPVAAGAPGWVGNLLAPRGKIPYGIAICAGALVAWPGSAMVTAAVG